MMIKDKKKFKPKLPFSFVDGWITDGHFLVRKEYVSLPLEFERVVGFGHNFTIELQDCVVCRRSECVNCALNCEACKKTVCLNGKEDCDNYFFSKKINRYIDVSSKAINSLIPKREREVFVSDVIINVDVNLRLLLSGSKELITVVNEKYLPVLELGDKIITKTKNPFDKTKIFPIVVFYHEKVIGMVMPCLLESIEETKQKLDIKIPEKTMPLRDKDALLVGIV